MTRMQTVQDFVSHKRLALVGASSSGKKFGNMVLKELSAKGYQLRPVHPTAASIGGQACVPDLGALRGQVDGVIIVVPPAQTERVVEQAAEAGIRRIWMQQGAESARAIELCAQHGLSEVHGECILMFAEPAGVPHRVHRFFKRVFGSLPA